MSAITTTDHTDAARAPATAAPARASEVAPAPRERLAPDSPDAGGMVARARRMNALQASGGNARIGRRVQAKLAVAPPGDEHEQEADRVAATVMRMEASPQHDQTVAAGGESPIRGRCPACEAAQRKCAACEESEHRREERDPQQPGDTIHRESTAGPAGMLPDVTADLEARIESPGGGRPLPVPMRTDMETAMGADFSNVRVHDGAGDRADADQLNATAFTHGSDIWIGSSGSANDRQLMAHELTHVVQQGGDSEIRRRPVASDDVLQRDPQSDAPSTAHVPPQPVEEESRARFYGESFSYLLKDDIQWHNNFLMDAFGLVVSGNLERRKKLGSVVIAETSTAVLAEGIGLPLKQGGRELSEYLTKQIDDYGLIGSQAFAVHVPRFLIRQQFGEKEFDAYWASVKANYDWQQRGFLLVASSNIAAGTGKGSAKPGSGGQKTPDRPSWVDEQRDQVTDLLERTRKERFRPKDLPDRIVLWFNDRNNSWYFNVWVQLDAQGKEKRVEPVQLKPGETPEELLERLRTATRQALQEGEDRERRETAKLAPEWARKLERELKHRLDTLRAKEKGAKDFPDGMVLVPGGNVQLQIWVERGESSVQRNYGSVPLLPESTADELVPYVRKVSALLREYEQTPMGGPDAPAVMLDDPKNLLLRAFPAEIVPIDLRNDNISVTGAKNEFLMSMDFEAVYGGGPLKDLAIASKLHQQYIHYYWEVHPVPADAPLPEGWEKAPDAWETRWQWLYDTYNPAEDEEEDQSEPPPRVSGAPKTRTDGSDLKQRVPLPNEPGDYLIRCVTGHAPIGESALKRRSSEAYYPVRVRPIVDVAKGAASLRSVAGGVVEAELKVIEEQLAGNKLKPNERQMLLARQEIKTADLARMRRKETQTLTENTAEEIAYATERQSRARQLGALLPGIVGRAKKEGVAPSDLLNDKKELITLYWFLVWEGKSPAAYEKELEAQIAQLKGVQKRAGEFSNELKASSPYQYSPEAAFVSELTGQVYPLVLIIGEAPDKLKEVAAHATGKSIGTAYSVIDVTSHQTQKVYYGFSSKSGPEGHREAIDNAFENFGEDATYGEGLISVRIPPGHVQDANHPGTNIKTYRSEEGILQKVLWALGIIGAIAGVAALVATGVGAGAAAGILGAVAATAGAIGAAHNISERQRRHTLELDAALILDIVSIVGVIPAVTGARQAIRTAAGLRTAVFTQRFLEIYSVAETGATVVLVPIGLAQDVQRIENDPDLTREQKDLLIAQARLGAVQTGIMMLGAAAATRAGAARQRGGGHVDEYSSGLREQIELRELEGFGKYESMETRGFFDKDGNLTSQAHDLVNAKPKVAEPPPQEQRPSTGEKPPVIEEPRPVKQEEPRPAKEEEPRPVKKEEPPPAKQEEEPPPVKQEPPAEKPPKEEPAPTGDEPGSEQKPATEADKPPSPGKKPRSKGTSKKKGKGKGQGKGKKKEPGRRFRQAIKTIDAEGELTDAGVKVLREHEKFRKEFAGDTDQQIKDAFARDYTLKRRGALHEALVRWEIDQTHAQSKQAFVSGENKNLNSIFKDLNTRAPGKVIDTAPLKEQTGTFVDGDAALRQAKLDLDTHRNPKVQEIWKAWYKKFKKGKVGGKKPDAIEFLPDRDLAVISDPTLAVTSEFGPVHAFKTLFYKRVLERTTGFEVGAMDIAPGIIDVIGD